MDFHQFFIKQKKELHEQQLHRQLQQPTGLDFCSNDYLGFSQDENLKKDFCHLLQGFPLGSTGSRLVRGENQLVADLETRLAQDCGSEAALVFATGYQANLGLLSALLVPQAQVFSDEFNHASIIDGIRLGRAQKYIFKHNDTLALERLLQMPAIGPRYVVVESIYSMSGDFAPIPKLAELCGRYGAHLIVDEAHGTGLYGECGSGRVAELGCREQVWARLHTGGKALGVAGAWVSGSQQLKELLINKSRPFIYSTGPSFPQLLLLKVAWEYWQQRGREIAIRQLAKVHDLRQRLAETLRTGKISATTGPIISFVIGDVPTAMRWSAELAQAGIDVRAIRPPTVPANEAMLRITLPGNRTASEVAQLIAECKRIDGELAP